MQGAGQKPTWLSDEDGYLQPFDGVIRARHERVGALRGRIEAAEGSLGAFARGYASFGWHRDAATGDVRVREWLPGAQAVFVFGDFNAWRRHEFPLARDEFGVWRGTVSGALLRHGHFVKLGVVAQSGAFLERVPAWSVRCEKRPPNVHLDGVFWEPPQPHVWKNERPAMQNARLRVYEAHVGMCTEEGRVGTFDEFRRDVLPHVAALGYNALQLMGVMEHPYYGSFGYQVRGELSCLVD
jgi:1,4-alpha-glucan branching enzyme